MIDSMPEWPHKEYALSLVDLITFFINSYVVFNFHPIANARNADAKITRQRTLTSTQKYIKYMSHVTPRTHM